MVDRDVPPFTVVSPSLFSALEELSSATEPHDSRDGPKSGAR